MHEDGLSCQEHPPLGSGCHFVRPGRPRNWLGRGSSGKRGAPTDFKRLGQAPRTTAAPQKMSVGLKGAEPDTAQRRSSSSDRRRFPYPARPAAYVITHGNRPIRRPDGARMGRASAKGAGPDKDAASFFKVVLRDTPRFRTSSLVLPSRRLCGSLRGSWERRAHGGPVLISSSPMLISSTLMLISSPPC